MMFLARIVSVSYPLRGIITVDAVQVLDKFSFEFREDPAFTQVLRTPES